MQLLTIIIISTGSSTTWTDNNNYQTCIIDSKFINLLLFCCDAHCNCLNFFIFTQFPNLYKCEWGQVIKLWWCNKSSYYYTQAIINMRLWASSILIMSYSNWKLSIEPLLAANPIYCDIKTGIQIPNKIRNEHFVLTAKTLFLMCPLIKVFHCYSNRGHTWSS